MEEEEEGEEEKEEERQPPRPPRPGALWLLPPTCVLAPSC